MLKAWTGEGFQHHGRFWDLRVHGLRPMPFTKPHPTIYRSSSTEQSAFEHGRQRRLILLNPQSNAVTRQRVDSYRRGLREAGLDDAAIAAHVGQIWVWRSIYVGETDADAEAVGRPAFVKMIEFRGSLRQEIRRDRGVILSPDRAPGLEGFICGGPATVAANLAELADIGIGGALMQFRLGGMAYETTSASIERLMATVAPQVRK
jgi:alkanesulfonate monooxygenase SsuD/methylene tetrahydromethanopterin reductase-like flavin-dependent oxidoreductase (luciferase family)